VCVLMTTTGLSVTSSTAARRFPIPQPVSIRTAFCGPIIKLMVVFS